MSSEERTKIKIASTRLGEVEIFEDEIIHFSEPILGFAGITRYVILEAPKPFMYLHSVDHGDLAFVVIDPNLVLKDYIIELPPDRARIIKLSKIEDAQIWVILTVPEDINYTTANLLAPVIINKIDRIGFQYVIENRDYPLRHRVFEQSGNSASAVGE